MDRTLKQVDLACPGCYDIIAEDSHPLDLDRIMQIEICYVLESKHYHWKFWDGPDGIDFYEGVELDLGQCFEQIIRSQIINGLSYQDR